MAAVASANLGRLVDKLGSSSLVAILYSIATKLLLPSLSTNLPRLAEATAAIKCASKYCVLHCCTVLLTQQAAIYYCIHKTEALL